jgi:hypothetical protein
MAGPRTAKSTALFDKSIDQALRSPPGTTVQVLNTDLKVRGETLLEDVRLRIKERGKDVLVDAIFTVAGVFCRRIDHAPVADAAPAKEPMSEADLAPGVATPPAPSPEESETDRAIRELQNAAPPPADVAAP